LPEDQKERRFLTLEEERLLVSKTIEHDLVVGIYVGILGEAGLRMEEGLGLMWDHIDISRRILTIPASKDSKLSHVPLSDYAVELLKQLPRFIKQPWVFVRPSTSEQLRAPRKEFEAGKEAAQLTWIRGFHDLRHFRASQWVKQGIRLPEVKELLGHKDIKTTMIYAHFDPNGLHQRVIKAQRLDMVGAQQIGNAQSVDLLTRTGTQGFEPR